MGWDNNVDAWQLCGCDSQDEYEEQQEKEGAFYNMIRQVVESENLEKLDIVKMAKESVKIDFAKRVN